MVNDLWGVNVVLTSLTYPYHLGLCNVNALQPSEYTINSTFVFFTIVYEHLVVQAYFLHNLILESEFDVEDILKCPKMGK